MKPQTNTQCKHCGYTWNSETNLMWINISNDEGICNELNYITENNTELDDYDLGELFKEYIEENFTTGKYDDIITIYDSWTMRDFSHIEWQTIAHTWRQP